MSDTAELTFELLKRLHGEFGDFGRDQASMKMRLSSLEQHVATMSVDIARINVDLARINVELDQIGGDVSLIKRRLDLADA